ncbi:sporulation protein YunB [Caldalkalibacillus mannanilyticus]|uniref:sporulation protein YunB n=1 Tax=Caldalkalibacillus mannanilyticus TaxID=1418 RepID=UPI000469A3AE|nr:sporulation protein YunB [Caldalkalibacillus mannanilyticus]
MSNKFKTNRKGPLRGKHIFLIVLILLTLISIQGFVFVERNLEPALKEIARTHVKQIAMLAINEAISKKISESFSDEDQLIHERTEGKIAYISFDQSKHARIVTQVTDRANQTLMELYQQPVSIPIGQALNSNILSQLGPDVPITLIPMGAARADIDVRMQEAGINNVMIVVYLRIEADVRIVIPFSSDEAVVTTEFPIDHIFVQGEVPEYYFKGGDGQVTPIPHMMPAKKTDSNE